MTCSTQCKQTLINRNYSPNAPTKGDTLRALAAEPGRALVTPPKGNWFEPCPLNSAAYLAPNALECYFDPFKRLQGQGQSLLEARLCLRQPSPPRLHPLHDETEQTDSSSRLTMLNSSAPSDYEASAVPAILPGMTVQGHCSMAQIMQAMAGYEKRLT